MQWTRLPFGIGYSGMKKLKMIIQGAVAEEIIVKVAHLTSIVCENPHYRNFIVNEMKNMDLLRHYGNDIQVKLNFPFKKFSP